MTDPAVGDAQRARIEALRRRPAPAASARRAHPAANTRVAAAALGVAATFGLVAVMGVTRPGPVSASALAPAPAASSTPSPTAANPDPVVVTPRTTTRALRPRVRTVVPPVAAPSTRTHGSR